ncbi:MAG: type 1 glutamine amidotransferase [Rhodospirillaceae bacterium]|nr:type 1 glutamine amidotransferase [Rhodospirillaceae bacterium]
MRILVIQNHPLGSAGIVGERIAARGGEAVVVNPHEGGALPPDPDGFDALLVLGGSMSAADDAGYPVFRPMRALMRDFHDDGRPVLGICLGAQLLARCFGQPVFPHRSLELGFPEIEITADGAADPLLAGLSPRQRILQWHEDTFGMPAQAAQLMRGADCLNQAFRVGSSYGFQCHLEATPDLLESWLSAAPRALDGHYGARAPEAIARLRAELAAHAPAARRLGETVADRWLDLVAARRQA